MRVRGMVASFNAGMRLLFGLPLAVGCLVVLFLAHTHHEARSVHSIVHSLDFAAIAISREQPSQRVQEALWDDAEERRRRSKTASRMLLEANTASARISNQTRGAELGLAGSNSSAAATNCRFKTPAFRDSTTTALASYPGSGSTVTRMLLELASGVLTGSVYKDPSLFHGKPYAYRGELTTQKVIAIKTHGPWKRHNMLSAAKRAVVLVRNPRQAIPSYFNWEWGDQHRNQHGVQAPEKGWVAWRNMKFNAELQEWKRFLSHWAGRHAHFILYEDIVDDVRGPKVLGSALAYLGEKVSPAHVQCTWTDVVHSRSRGVHRRKTYTPGYTPAQECALSRELWALARDRTYASHPVLGPALRSWAAAASCAPPPAHYKASPPPRLP